MISLGRAYVRIVEAADFLLSRGPFWTDRHLLRMVKALYQYELRELIKAMSAEVTAAILAANEKMMGPVIGFRQN